MATEAAAHTEKVEVRNRWTGRVQFTAEVECAPDLLPRFKLGLAVRWARENGVDLRGVDLRGAVLSGADLRGVDLSDAVLSDADLSDAVLSGVDLRGAVLSGAVLSGVDLRGVDLRGAVLSGAVLRGAVLSGAVLRGADLSDCPAKIPNIHRAIYEAASQPGALDMVSWHCGTAHCRAGWAVTLAGDAGAALEWAMGTPAAATMIYLASDPKLERVPNFYANNADALADMKRLAEAEAGEPA